LLAPNGSSERRVLPALITIAAPLLKHRIVPPEPPARSLTSAPEYLEPGTAVGLGIDTTALLCTTRHWVGRLCRHPLRHPGNRSACGESTGPEKIAWWNPWTTALHGIRRA